MNSFSLSYTLYKLADDLLAHQEGPFPLRIKKASPLTTHVNNQHRIPKKHGK